MVATRHTRFAKVMAILRLVIFAVIAVALVKFAFFPAGDDDAAGGTLDPSFAVPQMTTFPMVGSITNQLTLNGTIKSDPSTDVKSTASGEVSHLFVDSGTWVEAGAPILELKEEMPGQDRESTDADGNVTIIPGSSWYKYHQVTAPVSGRITVNALSGQMFTIGESVGSISPETYSASATLSPEQIYRIVNLPDTATVTIKDGPAPFECTNVAIVNPTAPATTGDPAAGDNTGGGVTVDCKIPSDQWVFNGLAITVDIVAGEATDVLILPVSAVEGRYGTGYVYLPTDDPDNPEKREVTLGITDGKMIEIKEGLTESDEVLEFTPLKRDEQSCDPFTGEGC
ncbi:MAG: efflux RND transporter periplasmic adaptor subunit [Actinomycetaceae bacterium]|nr:efflux RND transporter periplasmic adaptor subunit [Actinomycetaceae bacterium]